MTLHLKNVRIYNCGTGISVPKDARIEAYGLEITNTGRAIDLRDPPSLLQSIGLPPDTPNPYLLEALRIPEGANSLPPQERVERLRDSNLVKWLGISADISGLVGALSSLLSL